ncbi:hypothetical protein PIB30_057495 [Stylosanthes scabra]|uniref:Uncharacterized protein n=1 Tax=Stylosanthes scabra TaxID=79078 RepID=A0ABU6XHN5_9FABA|nr:hypothetical protein [Stylosanthes scabra]
MVVAMEDETKQQAAMMVTPTKFLEEYLTLRLHNDTIYASLTSFYRTIPLFPDSSDQKPTVEVTGHKTHSPA